MIFDQVKFLVVMVIVSALLVLLGLPAAALNVQATEEVYGIGGVYIPFSGTSTFYIADTVTYVLSSTCLLVGIEIFGSATAGASTNGTLTLYDQASTSLQAGNIKQFIAPPDKVTSYFDYSKSPKKYIYGCTAKLGDANAKATITLVNTGSKK